MKRTTRKSLKKEFLALTEDLFGQSVDATLSLLAFFGTAAIPTFESNKIFQSHIVSEKFLQDVNYDVIKNALITASKSGFIKRRRHAWPEITKEGKSRLAAIIPRYDAIRSWDGRLHIVTYDIPEKQKRDRDVLRPHLRRIGCAKLQDSVWLTPYNPIDVLREFIADHHIGGTVIISDLGTDASIGEENMQTLIVRLYHLEEINNLYDAWLGEYQKNIGYEGLVRYLAILKRDPQLPFALLPKWWKGETVYHHVKPLLGKLLF